jgi:hypothetical protein
MYNNKKGGAPVGRPAGSRFSRAGNSGSSNSSRTSSGGSSNGSRTNSSSYGSRPRLATNSTSYGNRPARNATHNVAGRPAGGGYGARVASARPQTGGYSSRGSYGSRPSFSGGRGGNGGGRGKQKMRGEYIDTAKFIYKPTADDLKVKTHEIKHSFADFKFSAMTNANLARRGYTTPSPIQDKTIPLTMRGADIIGLARTGSGKTAAFLLPLIQKAEANPDFQALILAPTRELATQINTELRDFTQGMRIFSTVCVGGLPIYRQIQDLKRRNNFIIATPGRLKDLADRGVVKYNNVGGCGIG